VSKKDRKKWGWPKKSVKNCRIEEVSVFKETEQGKNGFGVAWQRRVTFLATEKSRGWNREAIPPNGFQ